MLMGFWMLYNQISMMYSEKTTPEAETSSPLSSMPVYERILPGLNREPARLSQFLGKRVYIRFWTTWCPLCLAGLEDFAALAGGLSDSSDIAVISIVTPGLNGEVSKKDFTIWAKAQNLSFPIFFDESGAVSREFDIRAYPTAVYLGRNGALLKKTAGDEPNARIQRNLSSPEQVRDDHEKINDTAFSARRSGGGNTGNGGRAFPFR
ncbi:MAG: TlpA family protein disulfide reductase [Desulfovibrio sp.]|nr:TlpA family protein disulfide reductase [Desulfovibrio sp.]